MKLATYQDGSRDGQLVVVSRDLASAHYASGIASRLQAVLDDWAFLAPQLQDLFDDLNAGRTRHAFAFDAARCMAPLPRAYGHAEGAAYADPAPAPGPDSPAPAVPRLRHLGGGELRGAQDAVTLPAGAWEVDFEAGLAAITGDIPAGCPPGRAVDGVRLLMLAQGVALWPAAGQDNAAFHARPATAFSPVAVTPDECGAAWAGGRLTGTLQTVWNGRKVGLCDSGADMRLSFGELIAQMAQTTRLRAGTIVGTGPVRNAAVPPDDAAPVRRGRKASAEVRLDWPRGYGAIADRRAMEALQDGVPQTGFVQPHDTLRIEMKGRDGQSIFGAIAQEFVRAHDGTAL